MNQNGQEDAYDFILKFGNVRQVTHSKCKYYDWIWDGDISNKYCKYGKC